MSLSKSIYGNNEGGTNHKNVLRVCFTFTTHTLWILAPTFIAGTGLIEKELPKEICPTSVLHLPIYGLCIGAIQDIRHKVVGHLVLYRRERLATTNTTAKQRNFAFYRNEIKIPFIKLSRSKLYGIAPGNPISFELTGISWKDGTRVQLNSIVSPEQQQIDK